MVWWKHLKNRIFGGLSVEASGVRSVMGEADAEVSAGLPSGPRPRLPRRNSPSRPLIITFSIMHGPHQARNYLHRGRMDRFLYVIHAVNPDSCHLRPRPFWLTSWHHVNWQPRRSVRPHRRGHLGRDCWRGAWRGVSELHEEEKKDAEDENEK